MATGLRRHRTDSRRCERLRVHAAVQLTTDDGKPAAPLARCVEVGMGGIRITAAEGLTPGTRVHVTLCMPRGARVEVDGRVAWSRQTIHPALFGAPRGGDDDAQLGIAFDRSHEDRLLPIARLFAARERERIRARRIRRLHGLPIHA